MQGAERGLRRLEAAVGVTGPEALARILKSLKLDSMEKIDNLKTLKEIVLKLEEIAARRQALASLAVGHRTTRPKSEAASTSPNLETGQGTPLALVFNPRPD
jgi:hypothetical protein